MLISFLKLPLQSTTPKLKPAVMSQKLISSFFTPPRGVKRKHQINDDEDETKNDNINGESIHWRSKISVLAKQRCALSSNIGLSWFKALEDEFTKEYFEELSDFLEKERRNHTIYPPEKEVYSWTNAVKIQEIKVVILGQDPYHGPNQAHGFAFSVKKGVTNPPSLNNIFKEVASDIKDFKKPPHGNLYGWAAQGVLLLNTCLTVRAGNANSHQWKAKKKSEKMGWERFTDSVVKWIDENLKNVVFMLWGGNAKANFSFIDKNKHLVLMSAHPSPLSAHNGFFGCKHFSKANEYLKKHNKGTIDWTDLP